MLLSLITVETVPSRTVTLPCCLLHCANFKFKAPRLVFFVWCKLCQPESSHQQPPGHSRPARFARGYRLHSAPLTTCPYGTGTNALMVRDLTNRFICNIQANTHVYSTVNLQASQSTLVNTTTTARSNRSLRLQLPDSVGHLPSDAST